MESEMRKRLAVFMPELADGGAERVTLNLIGQLVKRNYEVDLVLAHAQESDLAKVPDLIRVVNLEAPRTLASLPALMQYLRREQPEAMLSVMNFASIVALWARCLAGVSTYMVAVEHNTLSVANKNASRWRSRLIPLLIRCFYPWADGIIAVSKGVADDLVQMAGLSQETIQVVYNPVISPEIQGKAHIPVDHPWFDPGQPPVILAAGRLRPQKDFPTLINAFAKVRQNRAARLLILGEGPERNALEALIRELGLQQDVSLLGFVENPYAYMSRASLFVLSSRWEGLPTVLIEALYCGVPVISTDCPSGPREILINGQYGSLVPVQDVPALVEAIGLGLSGHIPRPPEESWRPYELETIVEQYIRILAER